MKVALDLLVEDSVELSVVLYSLTVSVKGPSEIRLQKVVTGKIRNLSAVHFHLSLLTHCGNASYNLSFHSFMIPSSFPPVLLTIYIKLIVLIQ